MEILGLKTNLLNQNNYTSNKLTPEFIGSLVTYPINFTHPKCLPCDGYVLKIADYEPLYSVIGNKFNDGTEAEDEFRIPDYNITKVFLQPSNEVGKNIAAGLPNITGSAFSAGLGREATTSSFTGAFATSTEGNATVQGGADNTAGKFNGTLRIDASKSNEIYGNSTTVQPPSKTVHVCIRYK